MFFKKFVVGVLLVFWVSISANAVDDTLIECSQTDVIACDEVAVKSFVENTGDAAARGLMESLDVLLGDVNDPKIYQHAINTVEKEAVRMIYGTVTILGLTAVKEKVIGLSVKKAFIELIEGTAIGTGATKGAIKLSKGMLLGIIEDILKSVIKNVVYTSLKSTGFDDFTSRALSGTSVALVEQSFIYTINNGNPAAILLAEAELLFTRVYQIGGVFYELDQIDNLQARINITFDLKDLRIEYTRKFCQNDDDEPTVSFLNTINTKVDLLVDKYSDETDVSSYGIEFMDTISRKMVYDKAIYRYRAVENLKELHDKAIYFNYVNNYFKPEDRWFLKAQYDASFSLYSDVDIDSNVHKDIYKLVNTFSLKYITTGNTLNPSEYVGGKELTAWLDVLLRYVEKQDNKSYDKNKYASILELNYQSYLTTITFSQIIQAFYKEIYGFSNDGHSYAVCFSTEGRRSKVNFIINQKLDELQDDEGIDKFYASLPLKSYYNIFPKSLSKLKILPAINLLQKSFQRKYLISFGVKFLKEHKIYKNRMLRCKD